MNVSRCIFVGNIPYDAEEQSLVETLQIVGPINNFRIVIDESTGKPKGYGFCEYNDSDTALSALKNLTTIDYNGRQLRINTAENDKTGINVSEEIIRMKKEFSYLKNTGETNLVETLKNLSFQQKFALFNLMKVLNDRKHQDFKNLLNNQSNEFLEALFEAQQEFINDLKLNKNPNIIS